MKNFENLSSEQLELIREFTRDEVSGVYNRATTMRKIEDALENPEENRTYALLMIDIDNFKKINDTFGHQCGDSAIYHVAQSIRECFAEDSIVGRLGGDEFFAFVKNTDADQIVLKTRNLLYRVQMLLTKDNCQMTVSVSVGITMYETSGEKQKKLDELYKEADTALYQAKMSGKNTFAFADGTTRDDGARAEALSEKTVSLGIQELLNKLEIGIAIFRAKNIDELVPVFCNEGYLKLSGISFPQFRTQVVKKNNYGVHPEDIGKVRKRIVDAFQGDRKINYTFRLKTSSGEYKWMTMLGNIIEQDDGSFEIYTIFSDAEETMRDRQTEAERYRSLIEQALKQTQDALSVLHFNLARDECRSLYRVISAKNNVVLFGTVDAFINSASKNVSYEEERRGFVETFCKTGLLRSFEKGVLSIEKPIPITLSDDRIIWCKQLASLSRNPKTGDIECVASLVEDDKELRLKGYLKRIIDADYEFIGCINVKTKYISVMRAEKNAAIPKRNGDAVDYRERIKVVIEALIQEGFVDACVKALDVNTIISELEDKDLYVCTFPAKREVLGYDGAFQWRLGYADQHKKEIIMTRKETFSFLDKRQTVEIPHDDNWLKSQEISNAVMTGGLRRNKVLIADDVEINRELLRIIFEEKFEIIEATDGEEAIRLIDENHDKLALILLDMQMPKKTGLDVLIHNKMRGYTEMIPVMLVTGSTTDEMNLHSLNFGVSDIINKPYDSEVVKRRALNLIELYAHKEDVELQLARWKRDAIQMHELADKNNEMLIDILSSVVEFRSFESGTHIKRVRSLTEIMLRTWLGLYPDTTFQKSDIEQIARAATMHDIGKVAIPDSILQKPGPLTEDEFETMKKHTVLGCVMLKQIKQEDSKLYQYCYDICRYHHERDDGRGYPDGLKGSEIPVWAKIVSIVDVFDALTSPRVYKEAYSPQKAAEMIRNGECGVFAEDLLKCFEVCYDLMISDSNH